jgi:TrmH family RNA methyltransferase
MPTALSPQNPRLGPLRDLLEPRGRREHGRFLIEGPTLLAEARASGLRIEALYATEAAALRHAELIAMLEADGVPAYTLPEPAVARLSDLRTAPGLIAVAGLPEASVADVLARSGPVLLLAGVGDPGNAGTLVRSADAFGAAGVLAARGGVDPFSPKVVRAAMGSLFRLPVALVSAADVLDAATTSARPIVAADLDGEPLWQANLPANAILAVGNERHGVGAFLPRWDRAVRIEQGGQAESLNAAVAGSILLYVVSRRA